MAQSKDRVVVVEKDPLARLLVRQALRSAGMRAVGIGPDVPIASAAHNGAAFLLLDLKTPPLAGLAKPPLKLMISLAWLSSGAVLAVRAMNMGELLGRIRRAAGTDCGLSRRRHRGNRAQRPERAGSAVRLCLSRTLIESGSQG